MTELKQAKLTDLTGDDRNVNKGTERGQAMIEDSLREFGAGRSILVDKNNRIVAGNKTYEAMGSIGLEDALIVETDGKQLVVVKRTDIDLDSAVGRRMALFDNRTSQVSYDPDADLILQLASEGVDLKGLYYENEISAFQDMQRISEVLTGEDRQLENNADEKLDMFVNATIKQIVLYFPAEEYEDVIVRLGKMREEMQVESNTEVILKLMESYQLSHDLT